MGVWQLAPFNESHEFDYLAQALSQGQPDFPPNQNRGHQWSVMESEVGPVPVLWAVKQASVHTM